MPSPNLQLSTSYQTIATGAVNGSAVVMLSFCNTSGLATTIDVNVVPSAGSAVDNNQMIRNLTIPLDDTYFHSEKILLGVGETIQAKAGANTAITSITSYLDL